MMKEYIHILIRRKWTFISFFIATVSLTTWMTLKEAPVYKANSTVIVDVAGLNKLAAKDIVRSRKADYLAYKIYMETQREIVKSRRTAHQVMENLGLRRRDEFRGSKDPIGALVRKVNVELIKDTSVIKINVEGKNPKDSAVIANEFSRVYADSNNGRVQDLAAIPGEPVRPKKGLNIIFSIILGAIGGAGLALFREYTSRAIKDSNDRTDLAQLPVLGFVPKIDSGAKNIKNNLDVYCIVEKDLLCMAREAYRSIRINLLFALNNSNSAKSVVITSSAPKEGKTVSAINLAILMAHSGERTLLVDADMARPKVHAVFNTDNRIGFSDYLAGKADFDSVIKNSRVDNLSIVTSGSVSRESAKAIFLKNGKLFLEKAGASFSKIIFDTPSIALSKNAIALSGICDGVVLIAESAKATECLLNKSKKLLGDSGANIIGVVLNNVSLIKNGPSPHIRGYKGGSGSNFASQNLGGFMRFHVKAFCCALILSLFAGCSSENNNPDKTIVAEINKYKMTLEDLRYTIKNAHYDEAKFLEGGDSKRQYLDGLIEKQVLLQEAQAQGIDREKDFMRVIENYWEQALLKALLERKSKEISGLIHVYDNEIDAYYKDSGEKAAFPRVKNEIKDIIKQKKETEAMDAWISELKKKSYIKVDENVLKSLVLH